MANPDSAEDEEPHRSPPQKPSSCGGGGVGGLAGPHSCPGLCRPVYPPEPRWGAAQAPKQQESQSPGPAGEKVKELL